MFIRNCLVLLLLVLTLPACDRGLNFDSRRYLPPPTSDSSPEAPDDGEEDAAEDDEEDQQEGEGDQEEAPGEEQKEDPVEEDIPPSTPANLIKLTASGAPLQTQTEPWSDTGSETEGTQWACIEDRESGLVWEVKRPGSGHHHAADSSFSWFDPESDTNSDANGQGQCYVDGTLTSGADCNSRAFVDRVRAEGLCGRSNWRVPSADELHTLVEQQAAGQYHHTGIGVFPSVEAKGGTPYWSADSADAQTAWALDFASGEAVATVPSTALNLRLVSTNQVPQANAQRVDRAVEEIPSTDAGDQYVVSVTLTGEDPESDELTYSLATAPTNGVLVGDPPHLEYRAALDFTGEDEFTFTVSDNYQTSAPATVTIAIAPGVSSDPVNPTALTPEQLSGDKPQSFILKDLKPDDGQVNGYWQIALPQNNDLMRDLYYTVRLHGSRSDQPSPFRLGLFESPEFAGAPVYEVTASGELQLKAAHHSEKNLYLSIFADVDTPAPVYFEINGSRHLQENTLHQYCEKFEHPELLPDELCNGDTTWEISCDDDSCSAVNYSESVDLKFECAYRDSPEPGQVMRCHAYEASSNEFLYEICPAPHDCLIPPEDPQDPDPVDPEDPIAPGEAHLVKLGADGLPLAVQNLAWSDSGSEADGSQWACVQDTTTGLVWEVKQPGVEEGLHAVASTFSWHNPDSETLSKGTGVGQCNVDGNLTGGSDCNTRAFAERTQEENLCGLNDWRVPGKDELATLFSQDDNGSGQHIGASKFPGLNEVPGSQYWSNDGGDKWHAQALDFSTGQAVLRKTHEALKLRLVSGNQAPVAIHQHLGTTPIDEYFGFGQLDITLTGKDPEGNELTYTVVSDPQRGELKGTPPNLEYSYRGQSGEDSFSFTVSDGHYTSEPATVRISIGAMISTNPATPTPVDLSELVTGSPVLAGPPVQPFLLEDIIANDGQVQGYLSIRVPANPILKQDLRFLLTAQNIRSEYATHYTFDLFTEADFSGAPLTQATASDGASFEAAIREEKTLYVRLRASFDEKGPVYLELAGSSEAQKNRLDHYCREYEYPELVPYNLCNWEFGWDIGCDEERCIAVNSAPEVDLKYECDYRFASLDSEIMRCRAYTSSTGRFLHEICPEPHRCLRTFPDPPDTVPPITIPDPIEITFNTPGIVVEVPQTPAYGVNLDWPRLRRVIESPTSQQIINDFLASFHNSLESGAAETPELGPLLEYIDAPLGSEEPPAEIFTQLIEDTRSGSEIAGAILLATMNNLMFELAKQDHTALNNDEIWLLTILMAHINDRRALLVTTGEQKLEEYFNNINCISFSCLFTTAGFPDVILTSISETDADLAALGTAGGTAVITGAGTYFAATSSAVLAVVLPHGGAAIASGAAIATAASLAALPVAVIGIAVISTVMTVSNFMEANDNRAAYDTFISENLERFETVETFTSTEHSDRVQGEILNASIKMIDEMFR